MIVPDYVYMCLYTRYYKNRLGCGEKKISNNDYLSLFQIKNASMLRSTDSWRIPTKSKLKNLRLKSIWFWSSVNTNRIRWQIYSHFTKLIRYGASMNEKNKRTLSHVIRSEIFLLPCNGLDRIKFSRYLIK